MARIPYVIVDAFAPTPGAGNRVALVLDARGMTLEEMQRVAQRLAEPETAFVTEGRENIFAVRFFTPMGEVEFSGHAAVALGLALVRLGLAPEGATRLFLHTPTEALPVEVEYGEGEPKKAWVRGPAPRFRDLPPYRALKEVLEALGGDERYLHRGLPYGIAYTGLWSLFVPLIAPGVVDALEPEMPLLAELSRRLEVATVHAYAPMGPRSFYARDFAPLLGIPEDPVTGSANAALGALLARAGVVPRREGRVALTVYQGHRLGNPGVVEVVVDYSPTGVPYAVQIGGEAAILKTGEL
ncbi:PhzF family phenazine biosynthesis protein [Thermus thermamylovorans]|uniref:PhzF family phenazine biosynthesis protein n=1 Tax=Thermus thermamylovorans TaxID=2509362 RepID=A0A4V2IV67_9DEIN|nr:PhzF family phenazine biosynthesis protein [Thermus thermamylovorans]TBH21064.1 PhzF family phenazine biosynthesis protein [Thermus thermamylovorans]